MAQPVDADAEAAIYAAMAVIVRQLRLVELAVIVLAAAVLMGHVDGRRGLTS